jgi:X-X-X-Leu-X-X-Gly heptad repeat protein
MHRTRIEVAAVGNGAGDATDGTGDATDGAGERHGGR